MVRLYNPLLPDLSTLKDGELDDRINELSKKYHIAARTGMTQVIPQILMALEMYKIEMSKRSQQSLQNTAKRTNGNLDDLIKVN